MSVEYVDDQAFKGFKTISNSDLETYVSIFYFFGALANTVELLLRPVPTLLESWPLLTQLRQHRFYPYVSGFIAIAVVIFF